MVLVERVGAYSPRALRLGLSWSSASRSACSSTVSVASSRSFRGENPRVQFRGQPEGSQTFDFDVGKFNIKSAHHNWLVSVVVPKLKIGGSISIIGMASRTGGDALNMKLSQNRLQAVIDLLRKLVPNNFNAGTELAVGERAAWLAGVKDGVEQEGWRAVVVSVWDKPTRPPPPTPHRWPKSEASEWDKRWLGFGWKFGGQLGIGGYEGAWAHLWCLGNWETFDLQISSGRWGLGLGGSEGPVASSALASVCPKSCTVAA